MDQFANRYEIIHPANAAAQALMAVQAGIVFGALDQPLKAGLRGITRARLAAGIPLILLELR